MQIIQSRRDFLASLSAAGAASVARQPEDRSLTKGRRRRPRSASVESTRHLHRPAVCRRGAAACGRLHRCPLRGDGVAAFHAEMIARGEIDFSMVFARRSSIAMDAGQPITVVAGVHPGCFELFAHEPIRTISDLKGKKVGIEGSGSSEHLYLAIMAALRRARPAQGHQLDREPRSCKPMELFAEGQDRRVPRLSARAAGAARPQDRSRDRQ